jgi:hypothetical protein
LFTLLLFGDLRTDDLSTSQSVRNFIILSKFSGKSPQNALANIHDFLNHLTRRLAKPHRRENESAASFDKRKERFRLRRFWMLTIYSPDF